MSLEGIDAVVFDIGNVLLSFNPLEYLRNKYEDEELVNDLHEEIFKSEKWLSLDKGTITEEEAIDIISKRIPGKKKYVKETIESFNEMLYPQDSYVELAYELKKKRLKLYLLSNFPKLAFQEVYEKYEFFKIFDGGIISSSYQLLKPEKEIFYALIEKYNLDPKKTLFIDDTKENTDMAKTIGFKTLWTKGQPFCRKVYGEK